MATCEMLTGLSMRSAPRRESYTMEDVKRRPGPGSDAEAQAAALVAAARPLLVVARLLGLAPLQGPLRCGAAPPRWSRSLGWALYSWGLTALLAALMILALYTSAPTKQVQSGSSSLFRADIFVFAVTCFNDFVAVALLALANLKACSAVEALNKLVQCAGAAAVLAGAGRHRARWVGAQVGGTLLCLVAFMLSIGLLPRAGEDESDAEYEDEGDQEDDPYALLALAHLASLPLQLFCCLLFGNQVGLLWLSVRAINRRLKAMARVLPRCISHSIYARAPAKASARKGHSGTDIVLPTVFTSQLPASSPARWANPRHIAFFGKHKSTPLPLSALPNDPPSLRDEVCELHDLHAQLRHTLSLLTSAHSVELVLLTLITFAAVTTSLYIWLTERDDGLVLALVWAGLVSLFLFGVLTAGEMLKRESHCTMEYTQKLLIYHEMDPVTRSEVRRFSEQLHPEGLPVSVYGFLSLDYTMLQGMIGSVTTYLIMVIQLSPDEPAPA